MFARVALADRPLARLELASELFPEADDPLGALRWCLADIRRCCGEPQLLRGDPVRLTAKSLWLDVWALWEGTLPPAQIGGELLAGAEPRGCPAFDMWLMLARGRCEARSMEELRQAALRQLAAGQSEAAAEAAGRAAGTRCADGEGVIVLHRALAAARATASDRQVIDILRELAFVDVQAGRHASAARALREASAQAEALGDAALTAGVLAIHGMNEADQGRHENAVPLFATSAQAVGSAGSRRQEAWSTGVMARSLLLAGRLEEARAAAERSIDICDRERWNAFLPWLQALHADCLATAGT